ncbi:MAG: DUF1326 domain-containing protein [Chloroflexota bacterium]|nr:DUF1326 domain-containing protein [Chloroflexota bacterium]
MNWQLSGEYFENCNCDVVCPCLFSPAPQMTARPTQGACEVAFAFHVDRGSYGDTSIAGLNAALAIRSPGVMSEGNWSVAAYVDERADDRQREALQAIFTGAAGGPIANLAPLIGNVLGVKSVPIAWNQEGLRRSVEIPGIARIAVRAIPSGVPGSEIWASNASPFAPAVSLAAGEDGSTFVDYGMRWDTTGKNAHYAPINWSNS